MQLLKCMQLNKATHRSYLENLEFEVVYVFVVNMFSDNYHERLSNVRNEVDKLNVTYEKKNCGPLFHLRLKSLKNHDDYIFCYLIPDPNHIRIEKIIVRIYHKL